MLTVGDKHHIISVQKTIKYNHPESLGIVEPVNLLGYDNDLIADTARTCNITTLSYAKSKHIGLGKIIQMV